MKLPIQINQDLIIEYCKRHHIASMALFGSVLTAQFKKSSDVDVLVEFEKDQAPGFFKFVDMEEELSSIIGRTVDLKTPNSLSRFFREDVLSKAKVIYGS